jgi:hypothetical protein
MATLAVALACTAQSPAPSTAPPTGDQIFARVKSVFRSYPRTPYVAYTLVRRDWHNGEPDLENSYTLKIWCRTADRSALARRVWRGKAYGDLQNITVMFDREVDPGPPTADMFEKRLFGAVAARRDRPSPVPDASAAPPGAAGPPASDQTSQLPQIGRVGALDGDYRARRIARDGDLIHLWLEAKSATGSTRSGWTRRRTICAGCSCATTSISAWAERRSTTSSTCASRPGRAVCR